MTNLVQSVVCVLPFFFLVSCGDDGGEDQDPEDSESGGTDSETASDAGTNPGTDTGSVSDAGATGDVDALAACTDFQHASWDRIRACGSPTAAFLPPNELAEMVCSSMCEVEGKRVPQSEYDTCLTYATTVPCEDIDIDLDAGSQIPDQCAFLTEMGCLF